MMQGYSKKGLLAVLVAMGIALCGSAGAGTINVPGDQATITLAIAAATSGDEIVVAPGVYIENVSIAKSLTLRSSGGRAVTTIQGTGTTSVVTITGAGVTVTVQGFTITGGVGVSVPGTGEFRGGGIRIHGVASATITANDIVGNGNTSLSNTEGGGIHAHTCPDLNITDNLIHGNNSWTGAGVCIEACPNYLLQGNSIYSNGITYCGFGGGLIARETSNGGTIEANLVYSNRAATFAGGVDLWSSATLLNNMVYRNFSNNGGGIYLYSATATPPAQTYLLLHNTVANNTAGVEGAGVLIDCDASTVDVQGNIIYFNRVGASPSNLIERTTSPPSPAPTVNVNYNDIESPVTGFWDGTPTGNLIPPVDPRFVNAGADNYHLDTTVSRTPPDPKDGAIPHPLLLVDIDGEGRDTTPDMGADEIPSGGASKPTGVLCVPDGDGDGVVVTWVNHGTVGGTNYDSIEIHRVGASNPIATLAGNATTYTDNTALAGSFTYTVRGIQGGTPYNSDACISAPVPVEAPTGVTCTAQPDNETVRISWTNDNDPYTNVKVFRDAVEIADLPSPVSFHDDLIYGGTHTYHVVAYVGAQASPASGTCQGTAPVEAPTIGACTAQPDGDTIRVTWTNDVDDPYTSVKVFRDGGEIANLVFPPALSQYDDLVYAGTHTYHVVAYVGAQASPASGTCQGTAPVEVPTGVICTVVPPDGVRVDWTNDGNDPYTKVEIYRDGAYLSEVAGNVQTYSDGTAGAGTHTYFVKAYVGTQASADSATCPGTPPTEDPSGLTCSTPTTNSALLNWTNNDPYDSIKILRDSGPYATAAGTATTYTDTNTGGVGHTYAVLGVVGGADTGPTNACTTSITVAAPTGLLCPSPGVHTVNLSWTNGETYDSVQIYRDSAPLITLPGSPTSHVDAPVNGGQHTYQVRGRVGGTDSPFSDPCNVTVAVQAPDNVVCTPGAQDGVTLGWTNNDAYTGIDIVRDTVTIASVGGGDTTYADNGVESGTHTYQVVGKIGAASAASANCQATVPLDPPTAVGCVATGPDQVSLGWTNNDTYASIEIRRDGTLIATLPLGTETSYPDTFGGGGGGGAYSYTVTGVMGAQSAASGPCPVSVPVEGPSGLFCTLGNSVALSWTNNDPYDSIEIFRDGGGVPIATRPGTDTGYIDSSVGGGAHSYAVRGVVDGTPTAETTCNVDVPVAKVTNLDCQATGPDAVTITWTNPESYTGFDILRDSLPLATRPAGSTSYIDTSAGGGSHTYAVIGKIGSLSSDPATCTLDVPVDAPSGLVCTVNPDDSVDLSWTNEDPYDAVGGIEVLKDGVVVATLAGTATSHTVAGDGNGTYTFGVRGKIGTVIGAPATCQVTLGIEAPSDLTCDLTNSVLLTWINNDPYDAVDILRDGTGIASVGSGVASYIDSTADPGPHTYRVAGKIGAESAQSDPCDVSVPLPPVSNLSCAANGFNVQLSWINGYAYEQVQVFRNGALVATLPGASSLTTDTVPSAGNYQYWVRGLYNGILSDGSTDECAVSIEVTPPVQNLQCVVNGWHVTLTWQNPTAYDQVKILRGGNLIATLPGSPTMFEEDVPGPGDYTYGVIGTKGGLDSAAVECLAHVTFVPAPTGLTCTVFDVVNVHLAWTNAMPYNSIIVSRNGTDIATLPGTAISYDDLAPGVGSFTFGVRGVVTGFPASATPTCNASILAPAPVTGLTCTPAPASFNVALAWTNGGAYTGIEIKRNGTTIATLPGTATSHNDTVAGPGAYAYDVIPSNGPLSAPPATCNANVTYVPPVTGLACPVTYRRISMTWTNGFAYTGITVRRNGGVVATLPGTATSYSEIAPSGSYVYDVRGHVGAYVSQATACDATLASLPPPQNLTCTANKHNNLLSWSNGALYTAIRIVRNGSTIATIAGTLTSFVDGAGRGSFLYELFGIIDGQESETAASCALTNDYVDPPAGLTCEVDRPAKKVILTWTNGEAYANVEIQRNGLVIATLGGGTTSYVDTVPVEAVYTYAVIGIVGPYRSAEATCTVRFGTDFVRSDANADGFTDIGDAVFLLDYLFAHGLLPSCLDAADANTDLAIDIGDPIWVLAYLFQSGPLPSAPFPACGQVPEAESMGCAAFPPCEAP